MSEFKLLSVSEYAARKGISPRAVQKAITKGKLQAIVKPHPKRPGQVAYFIQIDEPIMANQIDEPIMANQIDEPIMTNQIGEPCEPTDNHDNHDNHASIAPTATTVVPAEAGTQPFHPCDQCKSAHPSCPNCCRICTSKCNSGQMCHLLVEHSKRAQEGLTGRPNGWDKIYDSLVDTPFLRPKEAINTTVTTETTVVPALGSPNANLLVGGVVKAGTQPFLPCTPARKNRPLDPSTSRPLDLPSTPAPLQASTQSLALPSGTLTLGSGKLSEKMEIIALRRSQVCQEVTRLMSAEKLSLNAAITAYLDIYNTGTHHPLIFATLDAISPSTLRRWMGLWGKSRDWRALIPEWKSGKVGHEVPLDDFNWIIGLLHSDGKPAVSSAIRLWHTKLRAEGRPQTISDRTMERAISVFAKRNAARWAYMRRGSKYFREHYLPSILIDGSAIKPGELWYSDGCVCNFLVWNPYTNKPCRPTFVPFLDYASRMIVGFDLDFTENRRVISSSYRNAITLWGFVPLYVKWDNGKAFKSLSGKNVSRSELEIIKQLERDEIAEIVGNIYATGVQDILDSLPYNPTGKAPMERFFGTFDNGLERYLPNYLGNSIVDKPASLMRNEKDLQAISAKLKGDNYLSLSEAKLLINWWIMDVYAMEPNDGLNGRRPLEVWQEGIAKIAPERKRNPDELWYLMLSTEIKKLDRNGVKIRGIWYYHETLIEYVGRKVYVRYDQMDDRFVFVYDEAKNPICRALARVEHDPLATVRGTEDDKLRLVNDLKFRRGQEKKVRKEAHKLADMTVGTGMFLQDAVARVSALPEKLTNVGSELPSLPQSPASIPDNPEDKPESSEVLSREFLDAIGVNH